jgi:DNA-binding protein YbaB
MEVQSCQVSEEALKSNDREMLEELIKAAANQALERARQQVAEETGKMASGLGLPPGMGLPGGMNLPGLG